MAWELMPRVAAADFLYRIDQGGRVNAKSLYDLMLWVTGSQAQADEAASRRGQRDQESTQEDQV